MGQALVLCDRWQQYVRPRVAARDGVVEEQLRGFELPEDEPHANADDCQGDERFWLAEQSEFSFKPGADFGGRRVFGRHRVFGRDRAVHRISEVASIEGCGSLNDCPAGRCDVGDRGVCRFGVGRFAVALVEVPLAVTIAR